MKRKNKLLLVLFIIAVILIAIGIIFIIKQRITTSSFKNKSIDYVNNLTNEVISGTNKESLSKLIKNINKEEIMTGNDMYFIEEFTDEEILTYNLSDYITLATKLKNNLETTIKDNFEYKIKEVKQTSNVTSITVEYKAFNYNSYFNDLDIIQKQILTLAGYDIYNLEQTTEMKAIIYKAKIKGANLLDKYLDIYKTTDNLTTTLEFKNNKIDLNSEQIKNYFDSLKGYYYIQLSLIESQTHLNELLKDIDFSDI